MGMNVVAGLLQLWAVEWVRRKTVRLVVFDDYDDAELLFTSLSRDKAVRGVVWWEL
jgi:hypothetical protein